MGYVVFALVMILAGLFRPVREAAVPDDGSMDRTHSRPADDAANAIDKWLNAVGRRRLFKPSIPLPARRMAGQTVDKVRSMIRLNAIMVKDGERVAYIRIQNLGLRPFRVGDEVEDLFAVTRIDQNSVEVEIAGERIKLDL